MALGIKKGDQVVVISGAHKGSRGAILKINHETNRVIVEGVNRVTKHQKPNQQFPEGGIIEKEAPIHRSNVMLLDSKLDQPTRVRVEVKDGRKVRVAVKSGAVLDG